MDKEIYISGQRLDLGEFGFTLSFSLLDLQDVTRRRAFKSSTITVPATKKNRTLFGFPEMITTRQTATLRGLIRVGVLTFLGDVQFINTETIYNKTYINFQIICGSLSERLQGARLRDLDLGTFTIGQSAITTARESQSDLNWALFDHGNFIDQTNLSVVEFLPIVLVDYLIEEILTAYGYSLHADSDLPTTHYLADFSKYRLNETNFKKGRTFTGGVKNFTPINFNTSDADEYFITPAGVVTTSPVYEVQIVFTAFTQDGIQVTDDKLFTADKAGAYRFVSELDYEFSSNRNFDSGAGLVFKIIVKKNGTMIKEDTVTNDYTVTDGSGTLTADTGFIHLDADDEITFHYYLSGKVTVALGTLALSVTHNTTTESDADSRRGTGYVLNIEDALPDWSILDFLKGYFTFNNLLIAVNEFSREVLILPYADFHETTAVDWSDKLVTSEAVTVEKYERPGIMIFQMVEDSNDITATDGDNKSTQVFSEKETDEEIIQANFARTFFAGAYRIGLPTQQIPTALEVPASAVFQELKYDFKTRLLNYVEVVTGVSYDFEGVEQTKYLSLDDTGLKPADFKANYAGVIRNMLYSKTMTGKLRITDLDLQRIITLQDGYDFRTPLRIDGINYYLIEVRGWDADRLTADCLLLQINDKNVT
jgi:hypothetical protein